MSTTTDELPECPLCMEVFELDDINFFPCTCGYQICRFCWHRLRTDENGLCPACRKSYPEDPAQFKPLTDEEVHKIKKERRQKETQRKQKSAENRKHLANVRVVQKNLVFVVGLPPRLTDIEVLKRPEFFGRFGKIHKVVINQSTSYVGSQGPSASAYVTYIRPEDALTAIKIVNNAQVDGRIIKASLGTTKYCSHFLKGTQCMKPRLHSFHRLCEEDCMYLHDLGDDLASFTKEEIQQGKHVQYEQKLSEQYLSSTHTTNSVTETGVKAQTKPKDTSPLSSGQLSPTINSLMESDSTNSSEPVMMMPATPSPPQMQQQQQSQTTPPPLPLPNGIVAVAPAQSSSATAAISSSCSSGVPPLPSTSSLAQSSTGPAAGARPLPFHVSPSDHLSLFSNTGFLCNRNFKQPVEPTAGSTPPEGLSTVTTDRLKMPNNSSTDWQENSDAQDDDLGFDPYVISAKGLADMIEKEKACNSIMQSSSSHLSNSLNCRPVINSQMFVSSLRSKVLPPGFAPPHPPPNGYSQHPSNANHIVQQQSSKMLNFMQLSSGVNSAVPGPPPPQHAHHLFGPDQILFGPPRKHEPGVLYHPMQSTLASHQQPNSAFNLQEWQDGLKALLPNINISFGTPSLPPPSQREFGPSGLNSRPVIPMNPLQGYPPAVGEKSWCSSSSLASHSMPDLSWDPAIINTGAVAEATTGLEDPPPHWMASLHHLTDDHATSSSSGPSLNNLLMHPSHSMSWLQPPSAAAAARFPPPGFNNSSANTSRQLMTDKQNLTDHKLPAS